MVWWRLAPPPSMRLGMDACRCASSTNAGEYGNGSARCGSGQHPSSLRLGVDTCRCTPPANAGESKNGSTRCCRGRHPTPSPGAKTCRCTPPTVAGESGYCSARCGGGRHPHASRRGRLSVRASYQRGRVREWLRAVRGWPAPLLSPSRRGRFVVRASTVAGESGNGFARCGGGRHPPPSRRGCLLVRVSHHHGRVW
jgi:hypothetical protein